MGLFGSLFENKFAKHEDVLDKMAEEAASIAVRKLKEDPHDLYCYFRDPSFSGYLELAKRTWWADDTKYSVSFYDYKMESIWRKEYADFLRAFKPHFEKHLKSQAQKSLPANTYISVVYLSSHKVDGWHVDDFEVPALSLSANLPSTAKTSDKLSKW